MNDFKLTLFNVFFTPMDSNSSSLTSLDDGLGPKIPGMSLNIEKTFPDVVKC